MYLNNKTEHFSNIGGCGVRESTHVSRCLKEELAWVKDRQLQVNSNKMTVIPLKTKE